MPCRNPVEMLGPSLEIKQGAALAPRSTLQISSKRAAVGSDRSVFAKEDISAGSTLAFCRRDEAMTPSLARELLPVLEGLTDRQCTASLLCLHKCPPAKRPANACRWSAYVETLPEDVLSPIFFSKEELALLDHTNLHGSTLDRRQEWTVHHQQVLSRLQVLGISQHDLPLSLYLWACVMLSSRAFPSHLIDPSILPEDSVPVLLPGLDAFNHNARRKVLWSKSDAGVALVTEEPIKAGEQAFNSYGPKSNEGAPTCLSCSRYNACTELLFSYGFALEDNEADTVAVKLGQPRQAPNAPPASNDIGQMLELLGLTSSRHVIFRSGQVPEELLAQMRLYLANQDDMAIVQERLSSSSRWQDVLAVISIDNEVRVLLYGQSSGSDVDVQIVVREQLQNMLSIKLAGLDAAPSAADGEEEELPRKKARGSDVHQVDVPIRPEVARLIDIYKQGQRRILTTAVELQAAQYETLVQQAEQLWAAEEGADAMETD
jgi:hypothetical protein